MTRLNAPPPDEQPQSKTAPHKPPQRRQGRRVEITLFQYRLYIFALATGAVTLVPAILLLFDYNLFDDIGKDFLVLWGAVAIAFIVSSWLSMKLGREYLEKTGAQSGDQQ